MGRFAHLEMDAPRAPGRAGTDQDWPDFDGGRCLLAANDHFDYGRYDAALTYYSRALRFDRGLAAAWVGQIRCLMASHEWREAITWSDRALDRFAQTPEVMACKGLAMAQLGDREGHSYLDAAIGMKTAGYWVWLARGEALLLHKTAENNASRCFMKALELTGDDWRTELRIGIAYIGAGMPSQARSPLLSASRKVSDNPLALYNLGLAQQALGERIAAEGSFSRAHALGCKSAATALETLRSRSVVGRVFDTLIRKR